MFQLVTYKIHSLFSPITTFILIETTLNIFRSKHLQQFYYIFVQLTVESLYFARLLFPNITNGSMKIYSTSSALTVILCSLQNPNLKILFINIWRVVSSSYSSRMQASIIFLYFHSQSVVPLMVKITYLSCTYG